MSIINRRNAFFGWTAWQVVKRVAKRKARAAVPGLEQDFRRRNRAMIALAVVAAAAGAVWLKLRGGGDDEPWIEPNV